MLVKSLLLWSLFWSAPRMENNLFSPCLCNDHGSYWAPLHLGLHLESWSAGICRPTCFLHKVNKRYFESLVHFGVASQNRKAGIYFKKWKWFGGRRHISSLVSSLRLENRSGAWGGGGGKGVVEGKAHVPMIVLWSERSSQGQAHLPRSRVRKGTKVLTLSITSLAPSHHMFSIQDTFVLCFAVTLGNHFHPETWVNHRKAICNFSSLHLAWTVESTFWPLWNTIAQEHSDGRNIRKSKATALIPFQCTVWERSHSWTQPMVWLWEDSPFWDALGTWSAQ